MTEHEETINLSRQAERILKIMNDEYEGNHYEGDFMPPNGDRDDK